MKSQVIKENILAFHTMKLVVPQAPLAPGALKIVPFNHSCLHEWQEIDHKAVYALIQKVIAVWDKRGIKDYLIYGKQTSKLEFSWEIVPYQKKGFKFWKQLKVLWNIAFGAPTLSKIKREEIAAQYRNELQGFSVQKDQIKSIEEIAAKNDAFCKQETLNRQCVYEGDEVNALYNYAPIATGNEKPHFLVVPKQHCERLTDLSEKQFVQISQLSQAIVNKQAPKGYETAYIFSKTGVEAGQTISHWHQHLVFTKTNIQKIIGKLKVFKNMLFGSSPLAEKELKNRVAYFKEAFKDIKIPSFSPIFFNP